MLLKSFHALFVQTDNTAGNQIVAYHRNLNGTLAPAGTYATGGLGGVLNGSAVDHLASQGSLTYDAARHLLYAVNAGSNTISVFSVNGDQLSLRQVINSGGQFPVSVAVHGNNVYVLNALSANVQGFVSFFGRLFQLPDSDRSLGITVPSNTNQFTNTPGQVAVSPNGTELIVTTKLNNDDIDVLHIGLKEGVEENAPGRHVEVLRFSGPEDILEQGEAVDAHFQAALSQEPLETAHEHGQHLVNIDDRQRRRRIDGEVRNLGRKRRGGRWEVHNG